MTYRSNPASPAPQTHVYAAPGPCPATAARPDQTWFRQPRKEDGAAIHQLISECPPLDLNSLYSYLLLSEHFPASSVVAGEGGALQGYVSAYIPPDKPDTLFVWQVAVHAGARGKGLGRKMLRRLLRRPGLRRVRYLETTVSPGNHASRALFERLARSLDTSISESPLFDRQLFGGQGHDDEPLLRIGPIAQNWRADPVRAS